MAANATIITSPGDVSQWVAAHNPIIVTASSTNTAEANFRYVVDIVFSYPSTFTKRLKMSARPDGFLLFDAHRIVENYLSYDFGIGEATDALACDNSYAIFEIQIGVEYGTTPVVTANLAYTGDLYAMPAALKHSVASYGGEPALIGLDWDNYLITNAVTGTTAKFLTSSPRTISICSDANYYLYTTYENEPIKLNLKVYIAGVPVINAFKTLTTGIDVFTRIGVGTKNINEWNASYLVGADYYTVQLTNNAGTALGEIFTFTIDCECSKWNETFRLHWLNPLGGFDAFTFVKRFDRTLNLKRASFKKILGSVDVAGAFTFAPSQAGKVAFDIHSTEQIKINSDNITEEQCNWIFTLAKSSQVFWEIDADTYAPVMITDSQYQQKTYAGQKLFNAHFTIEIGNDIISQRQ
jgi:hypothetical protein